MRETKSAKLSVMRARAARQVAPAVFAAMLTCAVVGCMPRSLLITPVQDPRSLIEHEVERESIWAGDKIALIDLSGVLGSAVVQPILGEAGDNPVVMFKEKLDRAAHDARVRAVVLRIDSPGGGVTASDLMYTELERFKEKTKKPVIACMLDVAASGGYYIACAADRIFAHPTTVTGSIGVIMITPDVSGTMAKLGIRANVMKSGPLKDAGSPFRSMTDADRAVFQGLIDRMYQRFVEVVDHGRANLDEAAVRKLADGRVFLGPEARDLGLVDEIGTLHDAVQAARGAAGLGDKPIVIVEYARSYQHRPNIYAQQPAQVNLLNVELPDWLDGSTPRFMYLWSPGW